MLESDNFSTSLRSCDTADASNFEANNSSTSKVAAGVRADPITGNLIIENGSARIVLQRDGTIRMEGTRIVGMAENSISLLAAVIDLN